MIMKSAKKSHTSAVMHPPLRTHYRDAEKNLVEFVFRTTDNRILEYNLVVYANLYLYHVRLQG